MVNYKCGTFLVFQCLSTINMSMFFYAITTQLTVNEFIPLLETGQQRASNTCNRSAMKLAGFETQKVMNLV